MTLQNKPFQNYLSGRGKPGSGPKASFFIDHEEMMFILGESAKKIAVAFRDRSESFDF